MRTLEIIVTHWTEPWETGKKFFDMLAMQRGADFSRIRVSIINDGPDNRLPDECFSGYPYEVRQVCIEHAGISAARNAGIDWAEARWIQFCDFDDMYAGVYSLRNMLDVLETDEYDILWQTFYAEDKRKYGGTVLHLRGDNTVFIHGKMFRLAWLKKSMLRFDEGMIFNEDSAFCTIASLMVPHQRIGQINSEAPGYVWCYREGSSTGSQINKPQAMIGSWQRDRKVTEAYKQYTNEKRHAAMVARTVCDAYWMFCLEKIPEELKEAVEEFKAWFAENRVFFEKVNRDDLREAAVASKREHDVAVLEEEERWGDDGRTVHRNIKLREWLKEVSGDV